MKFGTEVPNHAIHRKSCLSADTKTKLMVHRKSCLRFIHMLIQLYLCDYAQFNEPFELSNSSRITSP